MLIKILLYIYRKVILLNKTRKLHRFTSYGLKCVLERFKNHLAALKSIYSNINIQTWIYYYLQNKKFKIMMILFKFLFEQGFRIYTHEKSQM